MRSASPVGRHIAHLQRLEGEIYSIRRALLAASSCLPLPPPTFSFPCPSRCCSSASAPAPASASASASAASKPPRRCQTQVSMDSGIGDGAYSSTLRPSPTARGREPGRTHGTCICVAQSYISSTTSEECSESASAVYYFFTILGGKGSDLDVPFIIIAIMLFHAVVSGGRGMGDPSSVPGHPSALTLHLPPLAHSTPWPGTKWRSFVRQNRPILDYVTLHKLHRRPLAP